MTEIQKVGVVGAGMMGSEIALSFSQNGFYTVMSDVTLERAQQGKDNLAKMLDKRVTKGKITEEEKKKYMDGIKPASTLEDMADCDLVIEAAIEVLDVKWDVYKKLDSICKDKAIIASNTSSISITKLASVLSEVSAARFIGTHFNSPASVMKLVEIIPGLLTSDQTQAAVHAVLTKIRKEPVMVKDVTGFALNRLFHAFYLEACRLIEEGVCSVEDVDKVCLYGLGHPMGIFKLLDLTGHDLNMNVDQILFDAYGDRFRPSAYIQRLVDAGKLGKKTGEGFYKY